ncbi:hypothetical protein AAFF_G00211540 [Aldrovandia affinis]|uniref:Uncharacterized protein n=1 Tax=Aldrovandia affinis TaxID=143900 RepID=A0AAD7WV28_9TELE|nr:hypothetical protein AAFF_G00211540 [Aldrovandia affinis]
MAHGTDPQRAQAHNQRSHRQRRAAEHSACQVSFSPRNTNPPPSPMRQGGKKTRQGHIGDRQGVGSEGGLTERPHFLPPPAPGTHSFREDELLLQGRKHTGCSSIAHTGGAPVPTRRPAQTVD